MSDYDDYPAGLKVRLKGNGGTVLDAVTAGGIDDMGNVRVILTAPAGPAGWPEFMIEYLREGE